MATDIAVIDKQEIEDFRSSASLSIETAKRLALGIVDAASLAQAATYMLDAKARVKTIKNRLKDPRDKARAAWQGWVDLENELIEPYTRIENEIIKPAMLRYEDAQEKARMKAEAELREKKRKEAEDAKLAAAQEAKDQGHGDLSETILNDPLNEEPAIVPKAEAPAGISYRESWDFEVIDQRMIPREYLMIDDRKIGGVVRALKGETRIAGIRVFTKKTIAGRV